MRTLCNSAAVRLGQAVLSLGILLAGREALANTLTQNSSWTIDRAGTTAKYRVVAYGDSIFAGYNGSLSNVDKRAATWVQGEYLSNSWNSDIEVIRRTKSGAKADDIYNNKIVNEKSHMQAANTRVVTFEMCGNDFLQARDSFADQSGTCSYGVLDTALANCTKYQELAMQFINANANAATKKKMIMNLYYPGYDADNGMSSCTEASTGQKINKQDAMFPRLARSNYRACKFAAQYGFECVDAFAEYMGADYDSNGDGKIDVDGLRYIPGETEEAYVKRITSTLRGTIRDANSHYESAGTSFDYILSDNTHPTYSGATIYVGLLGGTGSGSGAPEYSGAQIVGGKNPVWNRFGHERAGWAHALFNPLAP
ncbi:SGNH/GDSL hydrolase family protein [Polyangium mundeleinium]|uniref:SGNH/GDSL hydrolase family protein n=1 Tax=Polyangium mundeleinium TaxID=2995306 RepID=A0ABT5EXA5_9BACT|nr:SGNH/GDSL hydrolase family protein [Polyangium mundeleinium]MDC0746451.1 SGNH/GDSL hydrolase family protein [Polyangium mundeleinium]